MKNGIVALAGITLVSLGLSTTALAELTPFYKEVNDEWVCGYKDDHGKVVVPIRAYYSCGYFSDGLAYVGKQIPSFDLHDSPAYLQGFIDHTGKLVIPIEHEVADNLLGEEYRSFSDGLVAVLRDKKYGYMNKQRELVIPYRYEYAGDFAEGLGLVSINDVYGAIDKLGNMVVPMKFKNLYPFSEGRAVFGRENHWNDGLQYGFIDKSGNVLLEAKWDEAHNYSEGLAVVKSGGSEGGKWGVINREGRYVVEPKYDDANIALFTDAFEIGDGHYKDGVINLYNVTDKREDKIHKTSVTRYTIDNTGKVLAIKLYDNWDAVTEEWLKQNRDY